MQKPKLAATLLLFSMSIGMGLPLGWSSLATRLHAQTAELTTGPQARMHSILESEPEAGASFDAGGENEKGNERENAGGNERGNDAERRATLKEKVDVPGATAAELPQPSDADELLPTPVPEPQVGESQLYHSQPSEVAGLNWPTLPTKMGYDVLLASPVHEALIAVNEVAFSPVSLPSKSLPVAVAPPDPIRENPTLRSVDNGMSTVKSFAANELSSAGEWIDGYWAWLPEMHNYAWVSGVQRISPPGRVWIAGSWNHTAAGYQWLPGYWDAADDGLATNRETEHTADALAHAILPVPPVSRAGGPTKAPPNTNSFWVPGSWAARDDWQNEGVAAKGDDAYQWRDGYWTQHVNRWIWQPARVVFVGEGYRTISGYWDYEPQNRGQGYAAVVFHPQTLDNSNYAFEPYYPLSRAAALMLHLFVRADQTHLVYGDLYSDSQVASGYRPWYLPIEQPSSAPPMLDGSNALTLPPLLDYYQWQYHGAGVDFIASMARYAQHFRSAPGIRPAAQTDKQPELAIHEGLAGRVNASSFEQVVLGNVGGRRPLLLDGSPAPADIASHLRSAGDEAAVTQASATRASAASQAPAMSRLKVPVDDSRLERSLSSNYDSAGTAGSAARADSAQQLPRGAMPFGQRGNAAMLVLPGGRVVLAPPGMVPPSLPIGPGGALLPPPGFPLPPGPLSVLRGRFGHR